MALASNEGAIVQGINQSPNYGFDGDPDYYISKKDVRRLLIQAAHEFPKYYLKYKGDRSSGTYPTYEDFLNWFGRWFGELDKCDLLTENMKERLDSLQLTGESCRTEKQ